VYGKPPQQFTGHVPKRFWLIMALMCSLCLVAPSMVQAQSEIKGETKDETKGDAKAGSRLYPACTSCHGAHGLGKVGMAGPKLAGLPGDYLLKQMQQFQTGARGAAPGDHKGRQMAAMAKGPRLMREGNLEHLVAYIQALPNKPVAKTVVGNAQRGQALYQSCAACHGEGGQGIEAMGAPGLAGQSDWYLLAQLEHFAQGRRGYDPGDLLGKQMQGAVGVLLSPEDYVDVVAYINTLEP